MIIKSKISKYLLFIFISLPVMLFSQNKSGDQSIQLPEFVITGVQKISIPIMKKRKPQLIPILNNKFFKPYISPGKLSLASFSKPQAPNIIVHNKQKYLRGQLDVGAGIYSQPVGKFNIHFNKRYAHLFANISGINIKDYVPFSKYNSSKFKLGSDFNVSRNSLFLPGTKFTVRGNYKREQYYLYASSTPKFERKNEYYDGQLKIQNYFSQRVNFVLSGKLNNIKYSENGNNLNEATIKGDADFTYNWERFSIFASGNYISQNLKNSNIVSKNNFAYGGKIYFKINPSKNLSVNFGTVYSRQDTNLLIRPTFGLDVRLDKNLNLIVKYEPVAKFETVNDFQMQNKYLKKINFNHLFMMNNTDFTLAIRYQYYKYFEINGGVNYQVVENMPYFEGSQNLSDLELKSSEYVKRAVLFLNFLFYKGPYGDFFGNVKIQDVKFKNENQVPYEPLMKADLSYGFNFTKLFQIELMLQYYSKSYVDAANTTQLPAYINGAAEIKYALFKNLIINVRLENLLNRNNYLFSGYKQKPFDVVGGVNYSW